MRPVTGEGQPDKPVEDIEHPGAQVKGFIHEPEVAETAQYPGDGILRDLRISGIVASRVGQAEIGIAELVDAVDAKPERVLHRPEGGAGTREVQLGVEDAVDRDQLGEQVQGRVLVDAEAGPAEADPGGTRAASVAGTHTISACGPFEATRSPTAKPVTPAPTSTTVPTLQ